ncbi:TOM34 protein, partial [Polypterus senegalus]
MVCQLFTDSSNKSLFICSQSPRIRTSQFPVQTTVATEPCASTPLDDIQGALRDETPPSGNNGETPTQPSATFMVLKMPSKSRSCSVPQLKEAGNELFRSGQYGEAAARYTQAIAQLSAGKSNPEELGILYSNRAACYLKDGNCSECIKDCTASLELIPFGIKPLLRRAAAYEALERYHLAYVDYKTALQVDSSVQAAHDGINR